MKKIIILTLALSLIAMALVSCDSHNFSTSWSGNGAYHWHECEDAGCAAQGNKAAHSWGDTFTYDENGVQMRTCTVCAKAYPTSSEISFVANCYANSLPTKIVGNTVEQFGEKSLKGYYELIIDSIDGVEIAKFYQKYDRVKSLEDGATAEIVGMYETVEQTLEYVQGQGVRYDGKGNWVDEPSFVPEKGGVSFNLDPSKITKASFKDGTLTCTVPAANTEDVLGIDIAADVNVTIVTDGEVVLSVTMLYSLQSETSATASVSIEIEYSYDNQQLVIK